MKLQMKEACSRTMVICTRFYACVYTSAIPTLFVYTSAIPTLFVYTSAIPTL